MLPDHKYNYPLSIDQLNIALEHLSVLRQGGSVYVHCLAGVERSPLVCMGWLVKNNNLTPTQALDYLMNVHNGTNPLPEQLKLLYLLWIREKYELFFKLNFVFLKYFIGKLKDQVSIILGDKICFLLQEKFPYSIKMLFWLSNNLLVVY